jgi:hypothetical protein
MEEKQQATKEDFSKESFQIQAKAEKMNFY